MGDRGWGDESSDEEEDDSEQIIIIRPQQIRNAGVDFSQADGKTGPIINATRPPPPKQYNNSKGGGRGGDRGGGGQRGRGDPRGSRAGGSWGGGHGGARGRWDGGSGRGRTTSRQMQGSGGGNYRIIVGGDGGGRQPQAQPNPRDWKQTARESSNLATKSGETVDGSAWMASRRAKQEEQQSQERQRQAELEEQQAQEARERRKSQLEALKQLVSKAQEEKPPVTPDSPKMTSLQAALQRQQLQHHHGADEDLSSLGSRQSQGSHWSKQNRGGKAGASLGSRSDSWRRGMAPPGSGLHSTSSGKLERPLILMKSSSERSSQSHPHVVADAAAVAAPTPSSPASPQLRKKVSTGTLENNKIQITTEQGTKLEYQVGSGGGGSSLASAVGALGSSPGARRPTFERLPDGSIRISKDGGGGWKKIEAGSGDGKGRGAGGTGRAGGDGGRGRAGGDGGRGRAGGDGGTGRAGGDGGTGRAGGDGGTGRAGGDGGRGRAGGDGGRGRAGGDGGTGRAGGDGGTGRQHLPPRDYDNDDLKPRESPNGSKQKPISQSNSGRYHIVVGSDAAGHKPETTAFTNGKETEEKKATAESSTAKMATAETEALEKSNAKESQRPKTVKLSLKTASSDLAGHHHPHKDENSSLMSGGSSSRGGNSRGGGGERGGGRARGGGRGHRGSSRGRGRGSDGRGRSGSGDDDVNKKLKASMHAMHFEIGS